MRRSSEWRCKGKYKPANTPVYGNQGYLTFPVVSLLSGASYRPAFSFIALQSVTENNHRLPNLCEPDAHLSSHPGLMECSECPTSGHCFIKFTGPVLCSYMGIARTSPYGSHFRRTSPLFPFLAGPLANTGSGCWSIMDTISICTM